MDYDIFCDESRHIEKDSHRYMVIGGIWCVRQKVKEINSIIRNLKIASKFAGEIKWTKVTPCKLIFFRNLLKTFFNNDFLSFRCIVIDKSSLNHEYFNPDGGHDEFYYKMFYTLLVKKICPPNTYRIFLDYKGADTSSKIRKLHDVIRTNYKDFSDDIVILMNSVQSSQNPILQLTDLLIGAIGYAWNDINTSEAKVKVCKMIEFHSKKVLKTPTQYSEDIFEIFKIELRTHE